MRIFIVIIISIPWTMFFFFTDSTTKLHYGIEAGQQCAVDSLDGNSGQVAPVWN